MQLESSGGTNTNHPTVQNGLQAGTTAIGKYGLMPNTVKELINQRRQTGTMTPELQDLDNMSPDDMKSYIEKNPDLESQFANSLATKVIHKQGGDEDRAAYSWKYGDNLTPDQIPNEVLQSNPYVQKFKRVGDLLNQQKQQSQDQQDDDSDQ